MENFMGVYTPVHYDGSKTRHYEEGFREEEDQPREGEAEEGQKEVVAGSIFVTLPEANDLLVAYSGGKDSLAVVDLCVKAGKNVHGFFWEFIPGLDFTEYWCDFAKRRWGIPVHKYQHFDTVTMIRDGVFRFEPDSTAPPVSLIDLETSARADSGCTWVGYGYKTRDSMERNAMMSSWPGGIDDKTKRFAPLKAWSEKDVWAYLNKARIETPDAFSGRRSVDISLHAESLEYMRDFWPADYERILKVFPHARHQAARADLVRKYRRERAEAGRRTKEHSDAGDKAQPDQSGAIQPA